MSPPKIHSKSIINEFNFIIRIFFTVEKSDRHHRDQLINPKHLSSGINQSFVPPDTRHRIEHIITFIVFWGLLA